jgi:hypothetical protein
MFAFILSRRSRASVAPVPTEAVIVEGLLAETRSFAERHPVLDGVWLLTKGAAVGLALGLALVFSGDLLNGRTISGDNAALPPPTPFWNTPFPMGMAGPTAPTPFLPISQLAQGTR